MSEADSITLGCMGGLLFMSALFSSAETALFSLTPVQRSRSGRLVQYLIGRPQKLLVTVLLCNLIINVLYFSFSSRLIVKGGPLQEAAAALGVLVLLLIFGEILPKTFGLRARVGVARTTAPILRLAMLVIGPLSRPLQRLLEVTHRRLGKWFEEEGGIDSAALATLMASAGEAGALLGAEADMMAEVIELDDIRVREIMTPRVDALFLNIDGEGRAEVVAQAVARRQSWLPVVEGGPDNIKGGVLVRDLMLDETRPISQLVMPIKFVPEVASALSLLHALREDRTSEAVVVDEWGGTAGYVTAEDMFEELVGELRTENEQRRHAVVSLGENRYRVDGGIAIRDWNEVFGQNVKPREFETLGGFVTALLGRIPRTGDRVRVAELVFEVQEVRGRRVTFVDVSVRPEGDPEPASGTEEGRR